MNTPKRFLYRMCGCEIRECHPGEFVFFHNSGTAKDVTWNFVAIFKDRHAAITYLAKEFAVPMTP